MKKYLDLIVRALLETVAYFCIMIAIFILIQGVNSLGILQSVKAMSPWIAFFLFLKFLISRRKVYATEKECKEYYSLVTSFTRNTVAIIICLQCVAFIAATAVNFGSTLSYAKNYPNADNVLKANYELSDTTLVTVKSLPNWYSIKIVANAESLQKGLDYMANSTLTDKARKDLITKEEKELKKVYSEMDSRAIVGVVAAFILAILNILTYKRIYYTNAMRNIKEGKVIGTNSISRRSARLGKR